MVLQAETIPRVGYQQQTYTIYQGTEVYIPNDQDSSYSSMPMSHTTTYSNYPQKHTTAFHSDEHKQNGWTTSPGYYGNDSNHVSTGSMHKHGTTHSREHAPSYPGTHSHSGAANMIEKVKHGYSSSDGYKSRGNGQPKYRPISSTVNTCYQTPVWVVKGIKDEEHQG